MMSIFAYRKVFTRSLERRQGWERISSQHLQRGGFKNICYRNKRCRNQYGPFASGMYPFHRYWLCNLPNNHVFTLQEIAQATQTSPTSQEQTPFDRIRRREVITGKVPELHSIATPEEKGVEAGSSEPSKPVLLKYYICIIYVKITTLCRSPDSIICK